MRHACVVLAWVVLGATVARAGALLPLRDAVPATTETAQPAAAWDGASPATDPDPAPLSPTSAVLYSLLLPGLGDYKMGNKGRAVGFFAAEGIIWISYAVFEVQGHQREDDYQQLAVQFAGVSRTGHSDDFYAQLREFASSTDYEADVKNQGRDAILTGGGSVIDINPGALDAYFEAHRVSDYEPWLWSSHDRQLQYSEVRSSSKTSYRRADYMFAAAAANRVVSAIVAYASARAANQAHTVGYHLDFSPAATGVDVSLALTRSF